jgi:ribonuclease-3 family protein
MSDSYFFNLPKINPDQLSPAVWAYIGDAVYELFVRHQLVTGGPDKTKNLHHKAVSKVRASFQADLVNKMHSFLKESELEIIKRGRNVKSGHVPPGSDPITYRYSTAFEALIGYLYLKEDYSRLMEVLHKTVELGECD